MTQFDFLENKSEYKDVLEYLRDAENEANPCEKAVKCRVALMQIVEFIYEKETAKIPEKATMLELLDGRVVAPFVNNTVILDSLHYIRKLGINAEHSLHIKKLRQNLLLITLCFLLNLFTENIKNLKKLIILLCLNI